MTDARISTTFASHPKTRTLKRRLGPAGPLSCVYLFLWAAANRSSGDLSGMSDEYVEIAADWDGEPGAFVAAMADVGFLDGAEKARVIHDWAEHNPWAAGSDMRSAKARWNAVKRHHGEAVADREVPDWAATRAGSNAASNADSTEVAMLDSVCSNAPSPSPSPYPYPYQKHLPEPSGSSCSSGEQDEAIFDSVAEATISIPLKGGGEHIVTGAEIREWKQVYQDKDVLAELKKARQWCIANPGKQKMRKGVGKFINGWLARQPRGSPPKPSAHTDFDTTDYKKDELEWNSRN